MDPPEGFKYIPSEFLKKLFNLRNESSSTNAQTTSTNITSNVRSTAAKSKKSTTNKSQKRTASRLREDKPVKRLKKTSTKVRRNVTTSYHFDNRNGVRTTVCATPKLKPTGAQGFIGKVYSYMAIPNQNSTTVTRKSKSNKVSSTETSQDSEQSVNTENVQIQNTNNIRNNLTDGSTTIVGEIPAPPKTTTLAINEKESDSQVEVSSDGLHCCPICFDSLKNKEVSATTCGHVFCKECILAVIAKNKKCPLCLTPLTKKKIHQLFI